MKLFFPARSIPRLAVVAALACVVGAVSAQPMEPAPAPDASQQQQAVMQQLQAMQEQIRQLTEQLQQIQRQALAANPELQEQQSEYQDLVIDTMSDQGYEAEAALERMGDLQAQLESDELSEAEQQAMVNDLRAASAEFRSAQGEAMQTEAVRDAQSELESDLIAAMIELNENTEALIAQLQSAQQEYQAMIQALQAGAAPADDS